MTGVIPDVVEVRSRTGPRFVALVRYKTAKLTQETVPAQKPAFCLFVCCLFCFVGFFDWMVGFWVIFQQEIVHLGFAHPGHRQQVTQHAQRSAVVLLAVGTAVEQSMC